MIEIRCLTDLYTWYHIPTEHNIADVGTRFEDITIKDIDSELKWQKGPAWMSSPREDFPLRTLEIKLTQQVNVEALSEMKAPITSQLAYLSVEHNSTTLLKIKSRYEYSDYLIDPNQ